MEWSDLMSRIEPIVDENGVPTPEYLETVQMSTLNETCVLCAGTGLITNPDFSVHACINSQKDGHF